MTRFRPLFYAAVACAALATMAMPKQADAIPILTFGQSGSGSTVVATTNPGLTQTTISAADDAVIISDFLGGGAPIDAFLSFTATSTTAAVNVAGVIFQRYAGMFSFTSLVGGGGVNYLSGTFLSTAFTEPGQVVLTLQASTPPASDVVFTSDILTPDQLATPRGFALSLANVSPVTGICGTTLCSFSGSVSGTMSASAAPPTVPEPASLLLLGAGLAGLGLARRKAA